MTGPASLLRGQLWGAAVHPGDPARRLPLPWRPRPSVPRPVPPQFPQSSPGRGEEATVGVAGASKGTPETRNTGVCVWNPHPKETKPGRGRGRATQGPRAGDPARPGPAGFLGAAGPPVLRRDLVLCHGHRSPSTSREPAAIPQGAQPPGTVPLDISGCSEAEPSVPRSERAARWLPCHHRALQPPIRRATWALAQPEAAPSPGRASRTRPCWSPRWAGSPDARPRLSRADTRLPSPRWPRA